MKVFLVGAGDIAFSHAKAVVRLGGEAIGTYDVSDAHAQRFSKYFGCPAVKYEQLEEYIGKADYVVICTPPTKRLEYVEKVLSAHVPLYMEKPIGTSMEDAMKLKEMAEKYDGRIIVGFAHHYRPPFMKLAEMVQSGMLGDPVNVFCQRMGPGFGFRQRSMAESWRTDAKLACGMTIESLSHEFNLLTTLGGPFKNITANVWSTIDTLPNFDTNSSMTMPFANGGIASINASWSSDLGFCMRGYIGTKGTAYITGQGLFEFKELTYKTAEMEHAETITYNDSYDLGQDDVIFHVHEHFQDCLKNDKPILTPLQDGIDALHMSLSALKSSKEHVTVEL